MKILILGVLSALRIPHIPIMNKATPSLKVVLSLTSSEVYLLALLVQALPKKWLAARKTKAWKAYSAFLELQTSIVINICCTTPNSVNLKVSIM